MSNHEMDLVAELLNKLKNADQKIHYYEKLLEEHGISYAFPDNHSNSGTVNIPAAQSTSPALFHSTSEKENVFAISQQKRTYDVSTKLQPENDKTKTFVMERITSEHIKLFRSVFRGREEFYAKRTKYQTYTRPCWNRYDQNGLCPKQRDSRFPCKECKHKNFKILDDRTVFNHLSGPMEDGSDVIGVYPITSRNTCWFIVYDFDDKNHAKLYENTAHNETLTGKDLSFWDEINSLADICEQFSIPYLLERSRSGYGAHLWIFFDDEIPCADARRFGNNLLSQGMKSISVTTFRTYDRMMPMQDTLEENQAGNLIALPLQGKALRMGNSAFINKKQQVYPNQWNVLRNLRRLSKETLYAYLNKWKSEGPFGTSTTLFESDDDQAKPWDIDRDVIHKDDAEGKIEVVLANGIYIRKEQLAVRLQNQIRRMGLYRNPEYFKAKQQNNELSNLKNPYFIYCGRDIGQYINLPRGCSEALFKALKNAGIIVSVQDKRSKGKSLNITFNGILKDNQLTALSKLNNKSCGIVSAATAFGKTVVGAALIAERKTSTLILVNRSEILEGWYETLNEFLIINEPLPEYSTSTGRVKKRSSCIGRYGGTKKELNGLIDIAMVQSLVNNGEVKHEFSILIKKYGMVIVDECHHVAGDEFQEILNTIMAKYVYGFTATPKRYDSQDKKMFFQLGDIRYRFSAMDRSIEQNIDHLINPRFTHFTGDIHYSYDYNKMLDLISSDEIRNRMIVRDVLQCLSNGRTPMILTKRVAHAELFCNLLAGKADHVFNMAGKMI